MRPAPPQPSIDPSSEEAQRTPLLPRDRQDEDEDEGKNEDRQFRGTGKMVARNLFTHGPRVLVVQVGSVFVR